MSFQKRISYKNPRHGAPGPIDTSKSKSVLENIDRNTISLSDGYFVGQYRLTDKNLF